MNKLNNLHSIFFFIGLLLFTVSCEKEDHDDHDHVVSNDGTEARLAYIENGYTEVEVNPMVKINCYFSEWDKEVMTPVSGLYEYYDQSGNWVASIDFGNGTCDEWATKTWDINIFPDYPIGSEDFLVFDFKGKK